jgi:dynein heavy chain
MLLYHNILDRFSYKIDSEHNDFKWNVFKLPTKVIAKCEEVNIANQSIKRKFNDEMLDDQKQFIKLLIEIEKDVMGLEHYVDINDVDFVSERVKSIESRINAAQEKARLFNAREVLFNQNVTDYEDVIRITKLFEPYSFLWTTTKEWIDSYKTWTSGKFVDLNAELIETEVEKYFTAINRAQKYFVKQDLELQTEIASTIKNQIALFRPEVPALVVLRNPGMRQRHWEGISKALDVDLYPIERFSAAEVLALNLKDSLDIIQKIGESAAKEFQIEQALDKMEKEWDSKLLQIHPYRETGTGVLKGIDDINVVLDEQITMTQTIVFSAFKGPFEERIEEWNRKLCMVSDVLEVWVTVQRNWLYLQPIFESADINRQLPTEGKKFATVDKNWRGTISSAKVNPKVLDFCDNEKLLERFKESEILLDQVQKGLADYLETKRSVFARFYFLSNDELLSILSESKDVKRVQPHLKKCFEGIDKVNFMHDLLIDKMISPEGEEIVLSTPIDPNNKGVEQWMLELEAMMRVSIHDVMLAAIVDYTKTPRPKWMQHWPGMCVLNGSQMHWTKEMEELFLSNGSRGPKLMLERQVAQLADMTILVRGKLGSAARVTVGALTVIDVHARDVIKKLVDDDVDTKDNFGWTSQLRYYWPENDLTCQMVAATRPYGYEYLGNTFRLVITPLTDKCYLTLMGALQMIFGGAPAGPAGTGKTETTKDLAKALAMQCVVFNCSDGLDYVAMGKFFKGLAACGAWACFDEFNRINIEVLSVIGQQIMTIQMAIRAKDTRINFEGSDIALSERFAVFITMNPGYAGRSALPDSLQALFRPVAMMVPDYALIGEIMFFAYGFEYARECGAKMVTTFKLCSEQLSAQPHYDYGMRAVKTTITAAGNLKRAKPDADEMVLLLRALQDVNIPKFLEMDLPLFEGIIADLFPGKKRPVLDYGALMKTMKQEIHNAGLQPIPFFINKVIQLYEMIIVRHGLMLVGPTGGGKSRNLHILEETLGSLKQQGKSGFAYEKVKIFQLNPKSITMGQMYGEFDPNTMEWRDGIMSTMYRNATIEGPDRKWIMFDGPVDAIWIENMNTVLDDNKKLCLNSGEIIKMSNEMTMMFEVEDLTVASPATVSRVGIIYMEPKGLGLDVLIQSWIDKMPCTIPQIVKSKLTYSFDLYLQPSIFFLRTYLKELAPSVDNNLCESLMRILDCLFEPFAIVEGRPPPTDIMTADLITCIDAHFIFALVWSIGITVNEDGRAMFDAFIRNECAANKIDFPFPKVGMVYDYLFSLDTKKWIKWMDITDPFEIDSKMSFSEIIVPTTDSVRNTYMLDLLLSNDKHVLMVGATGTGKTININQYLMGAAKVQGRTISSNVIPLTLTFSANSSANLTQDMLDSKMDKRRKGVFGPAAGKRFYVYVDDLNMPKREEYGAQPPIELLRQWFDQGGWYDRKDLTFRRIIDMTFVASMGPPGGGRQDVTPRFIRHFNMIGYVEMSDNSKNHIFGTILKNFLSNFEGDLGSLTDAVVTSSMEVFSTIVLELLPTPSKSHYTFNLRDLAKIFQGILMATDVKKMNTKVQLARLWVHESQRVFGDRLTCEEDRQWLEKLMKSKIENHFKMDWNEVVPRARLVYGDFMNIGSETRIYEEIQSMSTLKSVIEEYLSEHNSESKQPMPLVLFQDALEHVARISRILRQPQGNALLLGVGGSGRQSMTKLANYVSGFSLFTVEIVKGYSMNDWRDDIKRCLLQAGVKDKPTTFLFSDVQIINERMVEDINNILNAGDVPNLYAPEDLEAIASACRIECQKRKIPATKLNIFAQYITRVRRNIHLCVCMSPLGEAFRNRLRNFPSLVNCCTIDWFTNWPADALQSVGLSILRSGSYGLGDHENNTVEVFKEIHLSVEKASVSYYDVLRRRNYVTPTSYLELLSSFGKLIGVKKAEIELKRDRLQIGLNKLSETKSIVSVMQEELKILQPQIVKTQGEVAEMMVQITKDKASAAETKAVVEVEENNANAKAAEAKAIADDAQRDLDEALPALEEAVKCLNDLKKSDIDEVKSLKTPPAGVVLTIKVCCLMFEIKPIKKNDPKDPTKKFDDYWEAGQKGLLGDAKAFMQSLFTFDKDNIPDRIIKQITPFIEDPGFTPAAIERSSKACTAICMWARAMYKYHFVALGVAPKRAKLKEAEDELAVVMAQLAKSQAQLKAVNDRLAELEAAFTEAVEKKDMLEKKEASCKVQLSNADKLIGGLGGEAVRWTETVTQLQAAAINVLGDVIVSAGSISYLGVFTTEFRNSLVKSWQEALNAYGIPHTSGCNVESTLADPVKVRSWQLCSLPSDSLSTQNAIIMDNGRRWPLLIDPQGQANRYIRSMAKDSSFAENGMDVVKLSDKNFLRILENGVQFGRWVLLENILESLDAALEPILLQQKFKQGGQEMMKIGDNIIPYNNSFRFFMTTKLANPHYAPEVQVKVSLLNFTITMNGLEEQMLNAVVAAELPELASQKANLVIQNAAMNKQLYDIESDILRLLSNSQGNILDDTVLIDTLAASKVTAEEIKTKMSEAKVIEQEIVTQSEFYRPVAKRASLLYFVIADLGEVDPMYQYSLPWFTALFLRGVGAAQQAPTIEQRVINLNDYFTFSVYNNICRSLFERHKLLFSFVLCVKILQGESLIDDIEYRFLLSGISPSHDPTPMPQTEWLEQNVWSDLMEMSGLHAFKEFPSAFISKINEWRKVFDATEPHNMDFPAPFNKVSELQRLCILRCLRRDKIELCMQRMITHYIGKRYIEPPPFDLKTCFNDSVTTTPLIFVLSSGSDPNKELDLLAEYMNMTDRLKRIALGQGQGKKASNLIEKGVANGDWVMLQNCHLSISWMPTLEQICESFEPEKIHPDFRLWLTSMPSESFPTAVLQNGVKITKEPPKGLRQNLKNAYAKLKNEDLRKTDKTISFQKLLFGLSFYHALVIERKKFGPLGWNIPYEFNDTDMDITRAQLELYVSSYAEIPYKVLQQLTSVVNYGGRITDDKDMRTSDIIIADFFTPKILEEGYSFSRSGLYYSLNPSTDDPQQSYADYIEQLPFNAEPEVFGMHNNANITSAITDADSAFGIILSLQPRVASGGGISREDQIIEMAAATQASLPSLFDIEAIGMLYPTDYLESMNTVLIQEAQRYNGLLKVHSVHTIYYTLL